MGQFYFGDNAGKWVNFKLALTVAFTKSYVRTFEDAAIQSKDAAELTKAMQEKYPAFTNHEDLKLSAKVIKGEISWPK